MAGPWRRVAVPFRRARRGRHGLVVRVVPRKAQKAARLGNDLPNSAEAARAGDQVKEIAVFARGRVGPFAGGALAGLVTRPR